MAERPTVLVSHAAHQRLMRIAFRMNVPLSTAADLIFRLAPQDALERLIEEAKLAESSGGRTPTSSG